MAIKSSSVVGRNLDGDMTVEEFKLWLRRFDADHDGRISKDELRHAIRTIGGRFSSWKSNRGIKHADSDGNGFIQDDEIDKLIEFAQKSMGLKIVAY